jgi:hypothetical protein
MAPQGRTRSVNPDLARMKNGGTRRRQVARHSTAASLARWTPLRNSDHIRWTKVMSAQARMAVGYYERDEVKELLLDAVLHELARH